MKKFLVSSLMATSILLGATLPASCKPPSAAVVAPASTPAEAAQSFMAALKKRDLKGAEGLCDVAVNMFTPYGNMDGEDVPCKPKAVVQVMASKVTDSWTSESNPENIRVASAGRAYEPKYFFKSDKTYYALADKEISQEEWATFSENEKLNILGAMGYVIFLHRVNGRWLVFRVVENGVIASPR
ncbi:hypothetical protein JST97_24700 [bacterium]|nr:hypothetical protein [bacterium]